eukprot:scaffold312685_cov18-Tisochrysis_lutea.AAC.1
MCVREQVVEHVWSEVLLPAVTAGTSAGAVSASMTQSVSKSMEAGPNGGAGGDAAASAVSDGKGGPARSNMAAKRMLQIWSNAWLAVVGLGSLYIWLSNLVFRIGSSFGCASWCWTSLCLSCAS